MGNKITNEIQLPVSVHDVFKAHEIETVPAETVSFILSTGASDAGELAGTIVYGKTDKGPVLNKIGDRTGGNYGTSLDSSITFSDGVMVAAQQKTFIRDGNQDDRLTRTQALLTSEGDWAFDYETGLLIVNKATADTSIDLTYKIAKPYVSATIEGGTGLATSALQTTGNAILTTIDIDTGVIASDTTSLDTKTPALGTAIMTGSSPFTLATDDTQFGLIGAAADVDGNIHGQLRFLGDALTTIETTVLLEDATHSNGDPGVQFLGVRKDIATALASADGKYSPIITGAIGGTWTEQADSLDEVNDKISIQFIEGTEVGTGEQVASLAVATTSGVLLGFWVTNNSGLDLHYGVADAGSLPADATTPALPMVPISDKETVLISWRDLGGFKYTSGCFIYASLTPAVKTIAGATSQIKAWKE